MAADGELGVGVAKDFEVVNFDGAGGGFEILAAAGELVGALAVDFDGAEFGDGLELRTEEGFEGGFDNSERGGDRVVEGCRRFWGRRVVSDVILGIGRISERGLIGGDFAFGVAGGGGVAEAQGGFVGFVEFEKIGGFFGHVAREEDEQAGGKGVESAGVADFDFAAELVAEKAADARHHAKTGEAGGLVDEEDLVGRIWARHILQYYNRCGIMKQ